MTTKHANAELLIGFANGRTIQFKDAHLPNPDCRHWFELSPDNMEVWPFLLSTDPDDHKPNSRFMFRLAPRTIMIGDVECEAPVDGATETVIYYTAADGSVYGAHPRNAVDEINYSRAFASKEAAAAAHNAITKLLTGNSTAS